MEHMTDMTLLRHYAERSSESAFADLVSRHVNLVYSAALRKTGNPSAAEEITQAVFLILAKKAGRVPPKTILSGWLYQTARFTAASFLKREARRARREQEAPMPPGLPAAPDETWEQLAPLLEDAMGRLDEKERAAVVLRFFDNKSFAELATASGVSENAARKRVGRALDKLRSYFARRGVSSTTAVLARAIAANSIQAAPPGLAKSVTAAVLAKGAAVGGPTVALIKGALRIMAWANAKVAMVAGVSVVLAAGVTTAVVRQPDRPKLAEEMWMATNWESLNKLPPVLILRPTRFLGKQWAMDMNGKVLYRNMPLGMVFGMAYPSGEGRWILKAPIPHNERNQFGMATNGVDLMLTLTNQRIEALQEELTKQFGFVAHHEIIETNVLLLKVAKTEAPGLKPGKGQGTGMAGGGFLIGGSYSITNAKTVSSVAGELEQIFGTPVVDQTGLNGYYDINVSWDRQPLAAALAQGPEKYEEARRKLIEQAVLDQLGLELAPGRAPIRFLVLEKQKWWQR